MACSRCVAQIRGPRVSEGRGQGQAAVDLCGAEGAEGILGRMSSP